MTVYYLLFAVYLSREQKMNKQEKITVTLLNGKAVERTCRAGTTVQALLDDNDLQHELPFLGAEVNNDVVSLSYPMEVDCRVKLLTLADDAGWLIYRNSISCLLAKAAHEVFPEAEISIEHSIDTGFYCSFEMGGESTITPKQLTQLEDKMREYVDQALPIVRKKVFFTDALDYFRERNQFDKFNLMRYRNPPKIAIYQCGDFIDLAHAPLAANTSALAWFKLTSYSPGFVVQFVDPQHFPKLLPFEKQPQLFSVFQMYKERGKIEGVRTVGDLNERIMSGEMEDYIKTEEAFQAKQISKIADMILQGREHIRWVLIAGPSSSGKTTFAKRLRIQLRVNGIRTNAVSADNYFVERKNTPLDENGDYDFEHIDALDLPLLHKHMKHLERGDTIEVPRFDFHTGTRKFCGDQLRIDAGQVILVEGIHSLNPRLSEAISEKNIFKIYVSALTSLNLDSNNRISTTDNRLLRRMVRDYHFRNHSALQTLEMWPSVQRGEKRWIFPFQDQADVAFSSALGYELAVLKPFVVPLLAQVKPVHAQYSNARRMQTFLKSFIDYQPAGVPHTSILREFIGKSGFAY